MSNTVVGFTIEIDGVNSINELNESIKNTKNQMNALDLSTEEGNKQFEELSQTLGQLVASQKALKKAQDNVNKSFLPEKAVGAYDKASAKLNKLRKEFKNAAIDGSKSAEQMDKLEKEIRQLDATLKKTDAQVGQFQRNVGNYPKTFQRITRSIYTTIPGFEAFEGQLKNTSGGLSLFGKALIGGFVAFQAASAINRAMKKLDEFITKINETKETVAEFSGSYGEDLSKLTADTTALSETFNADAETISKAAQSLSKSMGISFEEALDKIGGALVEGRGDANDYLNTISQYPDKFQEASGEVTDFSERNRELLKTNQELAQSQVTIADKLQGLNDGFKNAKKSITTGLLLVLVQLIDIFRPVGAAFQRLGKSLADLFKSFSSGGEQVSIFQRVIETLSFPIKFLANTLQVAADFLADLVNYMREAISESPILTNIFNGLANATKSIQDAFLNLPFIFAGVIAAIKQIGIEFVNFNQNLLLDLQIFAQKVKGVFGVNVKEAIAELKRQRAEVNKDSRSIADAFNKGFEDAKKKSNERAKAQAQAAIKSISDAEEKEREKANAEARKKAEDRIKADQKKLDDLRKKFIENEINSQRNALAVLADLQARYLDEQTKNIKDEQQRQLKEIDINLQKQKESLDKQFEKIQADNKKRAEEGKKQLEEAVRLYGSNSKQVAKIREENAKALEMDAEEEKMIAQEIANIKVEVEKNAATQKEKVNADLREKDIEAGKQAAEELRAFRDKVLQEEQSYIDATAEMRQLKNKETLNKLLAQEQDANKQAELIRLASEQEIADKIAVIRNKIMSLDDAEAQLLDEQGNLRAGIKQEEYDAILLARQKLFTELSDIENKQTQNVQKNAEDQLKARLKSFDNALKNIKDFTDVFFEALDVANQRQEERYNEAIERSTQRQSALQEEIDNSTGLRRRFFEQQLESEIANAQKLEKAKEELAKKAAKQQKAQAILQSIINTALAVSAAYVSPPVVPNIPAAILAGILGAAQTAIIAAQPLAKGGVVGKGDEIVQFANGGKVTSKGNIKPLSNGDNVLATLKTGEVVLNESQQRRIGFRTLKAAGIPNFATGGVVGAPTAFINEQMRTISDEKSRVELLEKTIMETQNRIDRIQVVYTASTEDDVDKARTERKEIKTTASF